MDAGLSASLTWPALCCLKATIQVSTGMTPVQDGEWITGTERAAALSNASELQLALRRDMEDIQVACQTSTAGTVKDR